jgi:hypothetical protein
MEYYLLGTGTTLALIDGKMKQSHHNHSLRPKENISKICGGNAIQSEAMYCM